MKFIKDSINSWGIDPVGNCSSIAYTAAPDRLPSLVHGAQIGVWKAFSTRGLGEVISSDSY